MKKCWSKTHKKHYWFNTKNGKSQWHEPPAGEPKKTPPEEEEGEAKTQEEVQPEKQQRQEQPPLCFQCGQNYAREPDFPDCSECNPYNRKTVSYADFNTMDD